MTEQLPPPSSTGGYRHQPARGAYGAGADRRRRRARPTYTHMGEVKMASFETIFRIPSSHVLKAKFHSYGAGCPRVGATRNMTAGESLLRGMTAACTQTMTASEQAMAGRSLTSKKFSSRQRAICLYERTCPHRRADYTARHHRRRRRRARLASLSGILRGEYPQPVHTPRLQPRRVGIDDLVQDNGVTSITLRGQSHSGGDRGPA
jgi:hypothetical protein